MSTLRDVSPNLTGIHYQMPESEYRMAPAIAGSDAKHILPPRTTAHYAAGVSDTPETDEQINGKPCTRFEVYCGDSLQDALVPSEFARKLERERDEAREALRSFVQKMRAQAAVFNREDLRDNSRWSIFNEGRAQALEKMAEEVEEVK